MNGIVFDLKKFATHDGPGIRTSVFFKGCPLKCQWCHNPESIYPLPEEIIFYDRQKCLNLSSSKTIHTIGKEISAEALFDEILKDKIFFDESNGGVTFTGGEPLMQSDFLLEILMLCKKENIHTAVDTSGFAPFNAFEKINHYVDLYLYDMKLYHSEKHIQYTQQDNALIHENLVKLQSIAKEIIIRIPLIPQINDSNEEIEAILSFLNSAINQCDLSKKQAHPVKEINLLPFNTLFESKYHKFHLNHSLKHLNKQSDERLAELKALVEHYHFKVN